MFSYPETQREHPITPAKAGLLALLCLVWIGTGLIGHDPWKPDEAYSFGLVYSILQSGDWLVPILAGEPFMDKPPLFYITAAAFAKLFSPWLPLHDGARLASGFYTALTLLFTGLAGRELFGKAGSWSSAVILIGCLGLLVRAHQLITDLALVAGCAMMLYGYALILRHSSKAGLWIGTGMGVGFMAKGFIAPIFFLLISAGLLAFQFWRNRHYLVTLGVALLFALPWLTVWPTLLYLRSPALFAEWAWTLNIGHWFLYATAGHYTEAFYYVKSLPWLAWPALPLAAWAVWQARRKVMREPEFQLPLVTFAVMLMTLSLVPNIKEVFALPMLLPLTLLATASLATLRRGAANALDWFGIMTFGLIAILLWWGWAGLLLDNHAKITFWLKDYQPGFEPAFHERPFWIALVFSVLWVLLVWRVGRSMRRAIINWASGVTLIWILAMTLWLPWLDSGKSYRNMVVSLKQALPAQYDCIAATHLGDGQRAMLHYFGDILVASKDSQRCELLLVQEDRKLHPVTDETRWEKIWEGGRTGDRNEHYRLYRKISTSAES
ncbi:MAG: glycosyltransferase family 39 protein [Nitrosomonadales bacterium]|nr:glycosyltransferase family 39 protein [Nitrosomonadales bacterium]